MIYKVILALVLSSEILAGGWVGSGGESFFDAKNPWFLHGQDVKYCIDIETGEISLSKNKVENAVKEAFFYWQKEFKKKQINSIFTTFKTFKLGNNKFIKTPGLSCKGDEDLRFLFGSGSLGEEEFKFINKNSQQYLGIAVRTDYKADSLKGKGFIYISADQGKNAYELRPDMVAKAWSSERVLTWALIHELGHTFGISHTGQSFMSEVFMDLLLSKYYYNDFKNTEFESFVSAPKLLRRCQFLLPNAITFFELKLSDACLVAKWVKEHRIDIYAETNLGGEKLVATVTLNQGPNVYGIKAKPVSYLRLTDKQTVFSPEQTNFRSLVPGPLQERYNLKGKVIMQKSLKTYPVHLEISPEAFNMTSILNNKLITIFSYESKITFIYGQFNGVH